MKYLLSILIIVAILLTGCGEQNRPATNVVAQGNELPALDQRVTDVEQKVMGLEQQMTDNDQKIKGIEEKIAGIEDRLPKPKEFLTPDGRKPVTKEDWLSVPGGPVRIPEALPKPTPVIKEVKPVLTSFKVELTNNWKNQNIIEVRFHYLDQNGQAIKWYDVLGTLSYVIKAGDNIIKEGKMGQTEDYIYVKVKNEVKPYPNIPVIDFYFTLVTPNGTFSNKQSLPREGIQ